MLGFCLRRISINIKLIKLCNVLVESHHELITRKIYGARFELNTILGGKYEYICIYMYDYNYS